MIFLGEFKAGATVKYRANFHNDTGTLESPTSPEAQIEKPDASFTALTAPAVINAKIGHFGGSIDTTGFAVGQHIIRMAGTVATAKTVATEFCFTIVANVESDTYAIVNHATYGNAQLATAAALAIVAGYVDTEVAAILAAVDTEVGAIKAKTDALPADPASNTQVNTRLATSGYTAPDNTTIAAILEDTGETIPLQIGGLNDLSGMQVSAEVDELLFEYGLATEVNATANKDTVISAISNLTILKRIATTLAQEIQKPAEGDKWTKVTCYVRDANGDLFDPPDEQDPSPGASIYDGFGAIIKNDQTDEVVVAYADNIGTPLTFHSQHHATEAQEFVRETTGIYYFWIKVPSDTTVEQLSLEFGFWYIAPWDGGVEGTDHWHEMVTVAIVDYSGIYGAVGDARDAVIAALPVAPDNTSIEAILEDTGTTLPGQISGLNNLSASDANAAVDQALADYDGPTHAEATADRDAILGAMPAEPDVSGLATEANAAINKDAILDAILVGGATPEEIDVELSASHGPGLWGAASDSDIILTQATENTDGDAIGITTANATITAYLRSDTNRATPKRRTTAETDGQWSLAVEPAAEYTLVFSADGYLEHVEQVDVE